MPYSVKIIQNRGAAGALTMRLSDVWRRTAEALYFNHRITPSANRRRDLVAPTDC
jgi:hypothetical protein